MARRDSITITDYRGRKAQILGSGPSLDLASPAQAIIDAGKKHKRAVGGAVLVTGLAAAMTLVPPNRSAEDSPLPASAVTDSVPEPRVVLPETASGHGVILPGTDAPVVRRDPPVLTAPALTDQPLAIPADPPPLMRADAENGPFRAGMRTGFSNNQVLTKPMAEAVNIAFERFQHHGFSERASLTFAMQGINESLAGTALVEQGGGDGVGYFQFSRWDGNGVGAEVAALTKPGTDRGWQPSDFSAEDGDRATAIRNAVDATVQLLAEDPDYAGLNDLARDGDATFDDLARATTTGFMRPSTATSTRVTELTATLTRNEVAIRGNIDAFTAPERAVAPATLEHRASP